MMSYEVLDHKIRALDCGFNDRAEELQRRSTELLNAYRTAATVPAALAAEDEHARVEQELRATRAVHEHARTRMPTARHDAGRRVDRILHYRQAIEGAEHQLANPTRRESRQQAERDLGVWRPELEALEREDAAVVARFERGGAVAA